MAAMEGRARAANRDVEAAVAQAWHGEAFAREKRLKPLSKYLGGLKPQKPQGPAEMLAIFRDLQARGAGIEIAKVR